MNLKLSVDHAELAPGEYKAVIRVTVEEAFLKTLEIPVSLFVAELPPVVE